MKLQEVNSKDRAKEKLEVAKKRTGFNSPDEIARSGYADVRDRCVLQVIVKILVSTS